MPERAEVFLMTREFKSKFPPGSQIQKIKILNRDSKFTLTLSETDFPLTIKKVGSKGKKTYIYLTNGMGFFVSYGMGGGWKIEKTKSSKYCFVRADGYKYYWQTERGLHCEFVKYLPKREIRDELAKLGLDVYVSEPTKEEILARYLTKQGKVRRCQIHSFLMDQTAFCGVGNYLLCRVLYLTNISPHRRVCDLSKREKISIFATVKTIVTEVVERGGHTIFDWKPDDDRELEPYDVTPYGVKKGQKDSKGHKIKMEAISKSRHIYWVPATQK